MPKNGLICHNLDGFGVRIQCVSRVYPGVYPGCMQSGTSTASATATASKEIKSVKNSEKGGDLIEGAPKQPEP